MIRRLDSLRARGLALLVIGVFAGVLVGCTADANPGNPQQSASGAPLLTISATPTPTPTPKPTLVPAGTAEDNLPLFAAVTDSVWASADKVSGRAYIDALAAVGFDKTAMEVTSDTSTVGRPAESIQFAVRWGDQCLLGQVGPTIPTPVAIVAPALAGGGCLIGETRPIDW